jgi:hypothetical protein
MRILRTILLALIAISPTIIFTDTVHATDGGGSESQSEVHSLSLPQIPTKWKTISFKMGPSFDYWKKVAQCESQQNWKDRGNFSGGLGIAQSTWEGYGGLEFGKHPYDATPFEQIVVANRIAVFGYQTNEYRTLDDKLNNKPFFRPAAGFTGWGCIKHNSYLKYKKGTMLKLNLPVGEQFYCPKFEPLFKKYGLPWKVFSYVAWRESRCNPQAINNTLNKDGSTDSGLLQINSCWHNVVQDEFGFTYSQLVNPEKNVMFASWILHFSTGRLTNWGFHAKA